MNTQAASPGCPDPETISAVFDGEHAPDDALRAHLATCPDCAGRLADYAAMRDRVSRTISSEPDDEFNARIAAFVHAEADKFAPAVWKREPPDSRTAWILRIAALLMLSAFFVYLLMDRMNENRAGSENADLRTADEKPAPASADPVSSHGARQIAAMSAPDAGSVAAVSAPDAGSAASVSAPELDSGSFVKASLVSDAPSSPHYRIDINPMLIPDEFIGMPVDEETVPLPSFSSLDTTVPRRIPILNDDPSIDAMRMLQSLRRDLDALDVAVPGLSITAESRGNSLLTTISLEAELDMSVCRTKDSFVFFLMDGNPSGEVEGPVSFRIEFFCE